ncbi:hypothetical protein KSP40_PGU009933 [Platanthera guangdongensis]|uniref:Uncharacterized protein n=1 Tax=Platanthera guangdongensis TaxID=2320717 RepID=A0ABR2LU87_9ASPA
MVSSGASLVILIYTGRLLRRRPRWPLPLLRPGRLLTGCSTADLEYPVPICRTIPPHPGLAAPLTTLACRLLFRLGGSMNDLTFLVDLVSAPGVSSVIMLRRLYTFAGSYSPQSNSRPTPKKPKMAKRELSSTLKNLKVFMQRAAPKESKIEEDEVREPEGSVFSSGDSVSAASRRWYGHCLTALSLGFTLLLGNVLVTYFASGVTYYSDGTGLLSGC